MSEIIYTWKFEDKKHRSPLWYMIAFSITIGLAIWGFFSKQYGMSFIVLLIAGLTYFVENNSEDEIQVSISQLGIKIGTSFYDWNKMHSYSFIYSGEQPLFLRLDMNKRGLRHIDLKIDTQVTEVLGKILPEFLPEETKGELSFTEKLIHTLKL